MVAAELYGGIWSEIDMNDFDVFTNRAHLSASKKLMRLPSIWLGARFGAARTLRQEVSR